MLPINLCSTVETSGAMMRPVKRMMINGNHRWCVVNLMLALFFCTCLRGAESDIRRDPTVDAVQRTMPCVVNIATETVVPSRDSLENLFRDFFDPYYRNRPPNT